MLWLYSISPGAGATAPFLEGNMPRLTPNLHGCDDCSINVEVYDKSSSSRPFATIEMDKLGDHQFSMFFSSIEQIEAFHLSLGIAIDVAKARRTAA